MSIRERLRETTESQQFQLFVIALVIINAVTLGLETMSFSETTIEKLHKLDRMFVSLFILELCLRLWGNGFKFFADGWNTFDFVVIIASSAPSGGAVSVARLFRVLRVIRILRLVSLMPTLQLTVETTIRSFRGVLSVSMLLFLVIYTCAILATNLFGQSSQVGSEHFGNLGRSMYSLFQIMTLDSWSDGVVRELVIVHGWGAAVFFVTFIVITSFTFLNMFIAVFTTAMAAADLDDGDDVGFSGMVNELKAELTEIKQLIHHAPLSSVNETHSDEIIGEDIP
jgi:voltage-gated sodium channel